MAGATWRTASVLPRMLPPAAVTLMLVLLVARQIRSAGPRSVLRQTHLRWLCEACHGSRSSACADVQECPDRSVRLPLQSNVVSFQRAFVSYAFFAPQQRWSALTHRQCVSNLRYFLAHAGSRGFDLTISVIGDSVWPPFELNAAERALLRQSHITVRRQQNLGVDVYSHHAALADARRMEADYSHFVFLNCGTRGPYMLPQCEAAARSAAPARLRNVVGWLRPFATRLTPRTPMVGASISCEESLHLQSHFLVASKTALSFVRRIWRPPRTRQISDGANGSSHAVVEAVTSHVEVGLSGELLAAGFALGSLQEAVPAAGATDCPFSERVNPSTLAQDPFQFVFLKLGGQLHREAFKMSGLLHPAKFALAHAAEGWKQLQDRNDTALGQESSSCMQALKISGACSGLSNLKGDCKACAPDGCNVACGGVGVCAHPFSVNAAKCCSCKLTPSPPPPAVKPSTHSKVDKVDKITPCSRCAPQGCDHACSALTRQPHNRSHHSALISGVAGLRRLPAGRRLKQHHSRTRPLVHSVCVHPRSTDPGQCCACGVPMTPLPESCETCKHSWRLSCNVPPPPFQQWALAEMVVAHCTQSITKLPSLVASLEKSSRVLVTSIHVYSKCGVRPGAMPELRLQSGLRKVKLNLNVLANVGRNDHTYAHHLARSTQPLPELLLFVKDTTIAETVQRNLDGSLARMDSFVDMTDVALRARMDGFGCGRCPASDWSIWHAEAWFWEFYMEQIHKPAHEQRVRASGRRRELNITRRDDAPFEAPVRPLGAWLRATGVFASDVASRIRTAWRWLVPVCYGGTFAVRSDRVSAVPTDVWASVERALRRGDNIEEGHYMERMWAALLMPPSMLTAEQAGLLLCSANSMRRNPGLPEAGALLGCQCSEQCTAQQCSLPTVW